MTSHRGETSTSREIFKEEEEEEILPAQSLSCSDKMSLGGEDYGLISNNWWRRRERRKRRRRASSSSSSWSLTVPRSDRSDLDQLISPTSLNKLSFLPSSSSSSSPDNLFIPKCHITFAEQLGGPQSPRGEGLQCDYPASLFGALSDLSNPLI